MGVIGYFELNGVKYGIGTIVAIPLSFGSKRKAYDDNIYKAKFVGGGRFSFMEFPGTVSCYDIRDKDSQHITIVDPVYYQEPMSSKPPNIFFRTGSGSWDMYNEVCVGFIWYAVVMVLATMFNARIEIWTIATNVYFSWKAKK